MITYDRIDNSVARRAEALIAAWNSHDLDRVAECYAPDYEGQDVAAAQPQLGLDALREGTGRYFAAFPDLRFVETTVIVQGDQAVLSWTAQGTHRGPVLNIPATGRSIRVRGMSLLTYRDGLVHRASHVWDVAGLLRMIGLLPEL